MSNNIKYGKVLRKVLRKIRPRQNETIKLKNLSEKILKIANQEVKKYNGYAIIAGSLPRDTWLVEKNEFDIFLVFPKNINNKKLESLGLQIGKKTITKANGKWRTDYAQHPYIVGSFGKVDVDVVPCCKIEVGEKIISAVDRTPLHVEYLNENLPKNLSDDVRLFKQLLKANYLYGADAKTEGFSGYLCELLVIIYGSLINLLKSIINWGPKEIFDIENYWNKNDYKNLKKRFKDDILIVIDPVDKERNVAAPVSAKTFYKLKKTAREFIENPSENCFTKKKTKPLTKKEFKKCLKKRGTDVLCLAFKTPQVVPDILWPQLRKTKKRIESILKENEFVVLRSECWSDERKTSVILVEMQVNKLPIIDKKIGPWVFDEKNAKNFIEKHRKSAMTGPFIEESMWMVEVNRRFLTAKEKLIDSLKKKKEILEAKGIPNFVAKEISKQFTILENKQIEKLMKSNEFGIFLKNYFQKEKLFL